MKYVYKEWKYFLKPWYEYINIALQLVTNILIWFCLDDPESPDRVALISGSVEAVKQAGNFIQDILSSAQVKQPTTIQ